MHRQMDLWYILNLYVWTLDVWFRGILCSCWYSILIVRTENTICNGSLVFPSGSELGLLWVCCLWHGFEVQMSGIYICRILFCFSWIAAGERHFVLSSIFPHVLWFGAGAEVFGTLYSKFHRSEGFDIVDGFLIERFRDWIFYFHVELSWLAGLKARR